MQLSDTFKSVQMPPCPDWLHDGGLHHLFFPAYRNSNATETADYFRANILLTAARV